MYFSLFSLCFVLIALLLFFALKKWRIYVALIFSINFCFHYSKSACLILFTESIIIYLAGLFISYLKLKGNSTSARLFTIIAVIGLSVQLVLFKEVDSFIMPIGLSFYTFQMIGYVLDIYKGRIEAEKNPALTVLSFAWFPKIMSGPVENARSLMDSFKSIHKYSVIKNSRIYEGIIFILYGFFCKLVLADRIAPIVDTVFNNIESFSTMWLIVASLLYTLQIYFDFAGYSYIAVGVSALFGIDLMMNFRTPYFSENITEFWRRWHISLSNWLKEYVYFPLGGSRRGIPIKYVNLMIVFLVCGFWHGKGFSFIAWGLIHGTYSIVTDFLRRKNVKSLITGWSGRIITFVLVSFAWIFFRANSFRDALVYIKRMISTPTGFADFSNQRLLIESATDITFTIIILASIAIFIIDYISYKKNITPPEFIFGGGEVRRGVFSYVMIVLIFVFGIYGNNISSSFIYMKF